MVETLPAVAHTLTAARQDEQDRLAGDDPWQRADTQAVVWLRSPRLGRDTRQQYAAAYRAWRCWCVATDVPPLQARRSDVEAYTCALEQVGNPAAREPRPLSRRSVVRHMAILSSYYRRAVDDEQVVRNPVPNQRPKVSRRSPQPYLSAGELRALLAAADADGPRSAALVALLLLACLRVSEALHVDVQDLARGQHGVWYLRVVRKGNRADEVPLAPQAWQRVAPLAGRRRTGPLLATATGRRMDRKAAWKLLRRLGRQAGITAPIGPHTLRHAFITRGHELEVPVDRLQTAAGHAHVDTTRGYDRSTLDPGQHPSFRIADDLNEA